MATVMTHSQNETKRVRFGLRAIVLNKVHREAPEKKVDGSVELTLSVKYPGQGMEAGGSREVHCPASPAKSVSFSFSERWFLKQ